MFSLFKAANSVPVNKLALFANVLKDISSLLQSFFVPNHLYKEIITQLIKYMDARLFNMLLDDPSLCTASNALKMKMAISQIESNVAKEKLLHELMNTGGLKNTKDGSNLIVMDKAVAADTQTAKEIFPALSFRQMKSLLLNFKPDDICPDKVDQKTLDALEELGKKEKGDVRLDDQNVKIPLFT